MSGERRNGWRVMRPTICALILVLPLNAAAAGADPPNAATGNGAAGETAQKQPSAAPEAKPTAPTEAKPTAPTEAKPTVPTEAKPAAPPEAKPTVPAEEKPAAPPEAKPTAPPEAKPAAPEAAPATPPPPAATATPPPPGTPPKNLQPIFPGEATTILGKKVQGAAGEDMGRVVDVLVDGEGQPRAAVIDFGGFLGVGSRKIAVDWRLLQFRPTDHKAPIQLSVTRAEVQAAPEYKEKNEPAQVVGPPTEAPAAPNATK
jgi:hypothetical protein